MGDSGEPRNQVIMVKFLSPRLLTSLGIIFASALFSLAVGSLVVWLVER